MLRKMTYDMVLSSKKVLVEGVFLYVIKSIYGRGGGIFYIGVFKRAHFYQFYDIYRL